MEMKKLIIGLIAALGITASAMVYAGFPAVEQNDAIEKVTLPPVDDNSTASRKCPPFC